MQASDEAIAEKVSTLEDSFKRIYAAVYPSLADLDRAQYSAAQSAQLDRLEPPAGVDAAKAAAIVRALHNSGPGDKFELEIFYPTRMRDGKSVGEFARAELGRLVSDSDLCAYLRARGWR